MRTRSSRKAKNINFSSADRPSRFVVDLKEIEQVSQATETKSLNLNIDKFKKFCFSLAEQDFKSDIKKSAKLFLEQAKITPTFHEPLIKSKLFNELAFVELAKLFYRLCYSLGWLIVFSARFFYFGLLALAKFFGKPLEKTIIFIGKQSYFLVSDLGKDAYAVWQKTTAVLYKIKQLKNNIRETISPRVLRARHDISWRELIPQFHLANLRPVFAFAVILLILILPFKAYTYYRSLDSLRGEVLGASATALGDLVSAGEQTANLNFDGASQNFSRAADNFVAAQTKLTEINDLIFVLAGIMPSDDLKLAAASKHILKAGELSADLGKNLTLALDGLAGNRDFKTLLDNFRYYGHLTLDNAQQINQELAPIDPDILPEEYRDKFVLLKDSSAILADNLDELIGLADQLENFLGMTQDKRYLLVFQNNTELRASGGFIGSFALVDFRDGLLKNIETPGGGSYDTTAGLLLKIVSPEPLQLIAPQWRFWDANWWPDWPTSARKLMWFYEKSDGPTVDGVISFTPTVIEKLLAIIGPIDMSQDYGLVITADNFWLETQKLSERKADVTSEPKKIIGDLMNKMIAELPAKITKDNFIPLMKLAEESLSAKDILLYFTDENLQNEAAKLGADGVIRDTGKDYLAVINTNIAGGKSDRKISQSISHQAEIMPNGAIIDTVKITRTHQGIKNEPFCGVRNVDWMRIYVPLGSQLISASGFKPVDQIFFKTPDPSWQTDPEISAYESQAQTDEASGGKIYQELNKTVFANWSQVDPGQSITITLKYQLPFKINDLPEQEDQTLTGRIMEQALALFNPGQKNLYPYSLLVQKQPGALTSQFSTELITANQQTVWRYPEGTATTESGWNINSELNSDKFWAVLLEEK